MSLQLKAIIYSLIPLFGFSITSSVPKHFLTDIPAEILLIGRGIVMSLILGILTLLNYQNITFKLKEFFLGIVVIALGYGGLYFFNKSLEVGKIGVTNSVVSFRIIIINLLGVFVFQNKLNLSQIISIGIILVGVILNSIDLKDFRKSSILNIRSGVAYALLAAFSWGLSLPFFGTFSNKLGLEFFTFNIEIMNLIFSLLVAFSIGSISKASKGISKYWLGITIISIFAVIASLGLNFSYATGEVAVVGTVMGSVPLVTTIIGAIFFKERLKSKQYFALFFTILGMVILSLNS